MWRSAPADHPEARGLVPGRFTEDLCPPELWFAPDRDGPWDWKGTLAGSGTCLYGKFFQRRAGFVSLHWLPDFANFRRSGYDFDALYDDGLASRRDRDLYEAVTQNGSILSTQLKKQAGTRSGFEGAVTRLQMQTYLCIGSFVQRLDRSGRPYGWAVSEYTTPEALLGPEVVTSAYSRPPEDSGRRMLDHLQTVFPQVSPQILQAFLR